MRFLWPWTALATAVITISLLLLLYVLKLRRQRLSVASTLLWQKSFEDMQANVPFQRLRWSLLLLLQLLALIALLLALAEPVFRGQGPSASRVVLLIDRSASMNAIVEESGSADSPPRTRLDLAKQSARRMVSELRRASRAQQMMIVAFASSAQVVTTFQSDRAALLEGIDSIQPTDESANFEAALQLAGAFATSAEDAAAEEPPDIVLLSDGVGSRAAPASGYKLRAGKFQFAPTVESDAPAANIGIVSFSARREFDDPARALVFARLLNTAPRPIQTVVTLSIDDSPAAPLLRTIPGATDAGPGEDSFTHALDLPGGALLTLRHNHQDALAADDVAALVLPEPRQPRIAIVYGGESPDPYLADLLEATEPQRLDVMSTAAYGNLDVQRLNAGELYDLVVFDRAFLSFNHAGADERSEEAPDRTLRAPGIPSIWFGSAPAGVRVTPPSSDAGQLILSWDRQHPVMRQVALDTIVYAGTGGLDLPAMATPLAFGADGPVIAVLRARPPQAARHVLVAFEFSRSNWPLHISSAVFMQNVLDYLTLPATSGTDGAGGGGGDGIVFRPGEAITVRTRSDARELVVAPRLSEPEVAGGPARRAALPAVTAATIAAEPGSLMTLPAFRRAGIYEVRGAAPPNDVVAVSLLSDVESDIRPVEVVRVNAESAAAAAAQGLGFRALWPWLVAAALILLIVEWLVYCARARGR